MDWHPYIELDPRILCGKPAIRGTRISVELILEAMAAGSTVEDLLESYPHLKEEQVRAALGYAAQSLAVDEIHFVSETP